MSHYQVVPSLMCCPLYPDNILEDVSKWHIICMVFMNENETFLFWMEYFYFHIFSTFSFFLNRKCVGGDQLQPEHGLGMRWLLLEHLPNKLCANILIVHQHGFYTHELNHLKISMMTSYMSGWRHIWAGDAINGRWRQNRSRITRMTPIRVISLEGLWYRTLCLWEISVPFEIIDIGHFSSHSISVKSFEIILIRHF